MGESTRPTDKTWIEYNICQRMAEPELQSDGTYSNFINHVCVNDRYPIKEAVQADIDKDEFIPAMVKVLANMTQYPTKECKIRRIHPFTFSSVEDCSDADRGLKIMAECMYVASVSQYVEADPNFAVQLSPEDARMAAENWYNNLSALLSEPSFNADAVGTAIYLAINFSHQAALEDIPTRLGLAVSQPYVPKYIQE